MRVEFTESGGIKIPNSIKEDHINQLVMYVGWAIRHLPQKIGYKKYIEMLNNTDGLPEDALMFYKKKESYVNSIGARK